MATAGVSVDNPVTGMTGALVAVAGTTGAGVAVAGIGVADAQAETIKARMVRLKSKNLVFIGSSDQVCRHVSARMNIWCWVYNSRERHTETWAKVVKIPHPLSVAFRPELCPTLVETHPT